MESPSYDDLCALLVLAALPLCFGLALAVAARLRSAAALGPLLARQRGARAARLGFYALLAFAVAAAGAHAGELPAGLAVAVVALAGLAFAVSPAADEAAIGEHGVRRGWSARRFEQLEEWRLTGEHLRWRLRGEWFACRAPLELHPRLRELLQRVAAERESRFKD